VEFTGREYKTTIKQTQGRKRKMTESGKVIYIETKVSKHTSNVHNALTAKTHSVERLDI
jgi:hypothetical protein